MVHARVLDRHVPDALGVIGELVWHPAFRVEDVASEREVILEEIAMYADSPSDVVHELADELLFGGHGLGLPITGSVASISAASSESMRAFHASSYHPSRVVISAAGAVDHEQLLELVDSRFRGNRNHQSGATSLPDRVSPATHARVGSVSRDTEQVHVCLTWPGVARDDDRRFAAAVLDTVLGATPGSRLFAEVREERGLAYSVYSFGSQYADAGQLGMYLAVRPDRVTEAMTIIRQQIDEIREHGITSEELDRAHRHLEGRTLLSMESTTVRGNRLGAALITGMPIEPVTTALDRIRAVTREDVQEIATSLLNDDTMCVAIVAEDASTAEQQVCSALGLGDTPRVQVAAP